MDLDGVNNAQLLTPAAREHFIVTPRLGTNLKIGTRGPPGSCALAQDFGVSEAEAPQGGQGGGERALEPAPRVQGEFWNGKSEIGRARRGRSNGQNLVTSQELWARPRAETIAAQCVFVGTCCRREKRCRPSGEPEASPRVVCGRAPVCPFA